MSYTPTEWESTDVVTATRMNALEQAVGDMNMSYTPNTWSDGDILSAEKMNALEQAVASGGGGSSDFSTAQVTVYSSTQYRYELQLSNYYDYEDTGIIVPNIPSGNIDTSIILNAMLYKGQAMCVLRPTGQNNPNVSVSGNIQDLGQNNYLITGDCTITIS